jgi:hypothetical protein
MEVLDYRIYIEGAAGMHSNLTGSKHRSSHCTQNHRAHGFGMPHW